MSFEFSFDSFEDLLFTLVDGVLSFVVFFAVLGVALRITEWLIRRGVERRRHLMRGWHYEVIAGSTQQLSLQEIQSYRDW